MAKMSNRLVHIVMGIFRDIFFPENGKFFADFPENFRKMEMLYLLIYGTRKTLFAPLQYVF